MNTPEDVVTYMKDSLSTWLGTEWNMLKSCPSASGKGNFKHVHQLINRCAQLPAPTLKKWSQEMPPLHWTAKGKSAGKKTWCLLQRKPSKSETGEVALERKLIAPPNEGWWAQVPTASGLNVKGAKKRSIDVVRQTAPGEFQFIELKLNDRTNNPIYAASELITYALLYSCIRRNAALRKELHEDSNTLLNASAVEFAVFAPQNYYNRSSGSDNYTDDLRQFSAKVSEAFTILGGKSVKMSFNFRVFDANTREAFRAARRF